MSFFYCEYCGYKAGSVQSLTCMSCIRHPAGPNKGKHKLYEGSEKALYTCKYCGYHVGSIQALTRMSCLRHPNGANKGNHSPAL